MGSKGTVMYSERSPEALSLVERQGRWWFDTAEEEKASVSDLLLFLDHALAWVQGRPLPNPQGSVHEMVLLVLNHADLAGQELSIDGATLHFRAKCREHSDYVRTKFTQRRLPFPWLLASGIAAGALDADGRREIATVVRETVNHLGNHAREILNFTETRIVANAEYAQIQAL